MKFKMGDLVVFSMYGVNIVGKVVRVKGSEVSFCTPERQIYGALASELKPLSKSLARDMADIFAYV
jgi:hypothetical protein